MSLVTSICAVWLTGVSVLPIGLEELRNNFERVVSDKQTCRAMISKLESSPQTGVYLAYLGALQAIWAQHAFNPLSKLSSFQKGKQNIDKAVKAEPNNIEIICLRYSIQKNCPRFLGYRSNMVQDRAFLIKNLASIQSRQLKEFATKLLNN